MVSAACQRRQTTDVPSSTIPCSIRLPSLASFGRLGMGPAGAVASHHVLVCASFGEINLRLQYSFPPHQMLEYDTEKKTPFIVGVIG